MIQQIKHETGHVQFRVLRENATGQNSLQLSGSTPALTRALQSPQSCCPGQKHLHLGPADAYPEEMRGTARVTKSRGR
jgi:hypothetical protein